MRNKVAALAVVSGLALASAAFVAPAVARMSQVIADAIANPARPAADKARDALRKPGEVMAFSTIKPGDKVLELLPGGGYFSRVISGVVGSNGAVLAASPNLNPDPTKAPQPKPGDPAFPNVTPVLFGRTGALPGGLDAVFTAQNYHDMHLTRVNLDVIAFDQRLYDALKPGGVLIIEDHSALPGTDLTVPDQIHRINEDIVKKEVESVGFKLEAESDILRNPADTRTVNPHTMHDQTDQFLLRFRKPR
jgi:predicted methyltransferase